MTIRPSKIFTPNQFKESGTIPKPVKVEKAKGSNGLPLKKATGESKFFQKLWQRRPHVSFISGKKLGDDAHSWFFAHVLSKAKNRYPKFILYDENIVFLTQEEHEIWDSKRHTISESDPQWSKLFKLEKELKEYYKKLYGK